MHCNPYCTLVINDISRTKPCVGKVEEQIDRKGGWGVCGQKERDAGGKVDEEDQGGRWSEGAERGGAGGWVLEDREGVRGRDEGGMRRRLEK